MKQKLPILSTQVVMILLKCVTTQKLFVNGGVQLEAYIINQVAMNLFQMKMPKIKSVPFVKKMYKIVVMGVEFVL
jgi:hypothetical protein